MDKIMYADYPVFVFQNQVSSARTAARTLLMSDSSGIT